MSQPKLSSPFPLLLKLLKSSFVSIYSLKMMIILFPYWTGRLKYHDGLCWNIALITAIQVPIQDFWEEAGASSCLDASKVIQKVEPGSPCLQRLSGGLQLDTACIQSQLICFYQDLEKKECSRGHQNCSPLAATMGFLFTFLPCVTRSAVIATV